MSSLENRQPPGKSTASVFDITIQLGLVALLLVWCFLILKPFIVLVLWAVVLAVAIYPLFVKLTDALGGRRKLAATLFTLFTLALLITPTILVSASLVDSAQNLAGHMQGDSLSIPPPNENVRNWPLIGEEAYKLWSQASNNLEDFINQYRHEIRNMTQWVFSAAASAGGSILQFAISIIIAGAFMATAQPANALTLRLIQRIAGREHGRELIDLTGATIRSVAQGVLGIAVIQALAAGLGMALMDVPGWGLWTLLILILAVAQLPPLLVLGPVIVYVFSVESGTSTVLFAAWSLLVSTSDAFLKPLLLGRGMQTPMLVILLGAIGGMIMSGFLGLFLGAIVMALAYELLMLWLKAGEPAEEAGSGPAGD